MNFRISKEIENAILNNKPVVALESTIISHGMPYPENVKTALQCEQIIRDNGALPATIAIIKGCIIVGLSQEEIEYIGKNGANVIKTSRRDLPIIVSQKLDGATTVSATMFIASLAKIKIFATGGIGGVHRDYNDTMDVSADLEELARTNVCVVCAGIKAILDLPRTLEYLETKGVPVIGYQTSLLPSFYTRSSKLKVDYQLDSPQDIALMLKTKWDLNLNGGTLVTNPIPLEYSLDEDIMNEAINDALIQMKKEHITGKRTTPYLLAKVKEITKGESLKANIQLVYNNCLLASLIAKEYCKL